MSVCFLKMDPLDGGTPFPKTSKMDSTVTVTAEESIRRLTLPRRSVYTRWHLHSAAHLQS